MRSLVLGLLLVSCVEAVHAADATTGKHMVYGAGTESCGTYVSESHGSYAKSLDVQWVLGYISAYDFWASSVNVKIAATDAGAMEVWLNNYCQNHPLDTLNDAVNALGGTLIGRAMKEQ